MIDIIKKRLAELVSQKLQGKDQGPLSGQKMTFMAAMHKENGIYNNMYNRDGEYWIDRSEKSSEKHYHIWISEKPHSNRAINCSDIVLLDSAQAYAVISVDRSVIGETRLVICEIR